MDNVDESSEQHRDNKVLKQKDKHQIAPTDEDLKAFHIVKDIIKNTVIPERIFYKKNSNYLSIVLDNNNRRPLCRLFLHRNPKRIEIMDKKSNGLETIQKIEDIRNYAAQLINIVVRTDMLIKMVKEKITKERKMVVKDKNQII